MLSLGIGGPFRGEQLGPQHPPPPSKVGEDPLDCVGDVDDFEFEALGLVQRGERDLLLDGSVGEKWGRLDAVLIGQLEHGVQGHRGVPLRLTLQHLRERCEGETPFFPLRVEHHPLQFVDAGPELPETVDRGQLDGPIELVEQTGQPGMLGKLAGEDGGPGIPGAETGTQDLALFSQPYSDQRA